MDQNDILRQQIFEIIRNQKKDNDPPETNATFKRLKNMGYSDEDADKLIGQCVAAEVFGIFKHGRPFNNKRYIKNLHNLPKEPSED
ncbi:MAG: hypothetical protein MI922_14175 [Bacteroidales bacterium]|nr:hypothetical protein [Bacteroidales bacterium]